MTPEYDGILGSGYILAPIPTHPPPPIPAQWHVNTFPPLPEYIYDQRAKEKLAGDLTDLAFHGHRLAVSLRYASGELK